MAHLIIDQIEVLTLERKRNPDLSQRELARRIKAWYPISFYGRTYASIYGALRRVEKRLKAVVTQAITSAETGANTVGA